MEFFVSVNKTTYVFTFNSDLTKSNSLNPRFKFFWVFLNGFHFFVATCEIWVEYLTASCGSVSTSPAVLEHSSLPISVGNGLVSSFLQCSVIARFGFKFRFSWSLECLWCSSVPVDMLSNSSKIFPFLYDKLRNPLAQISFFRLIFYSINCIHKNLLDFCKPHRAQFTLFSTEGRKKYN